MLRSCMRSTRWSRMATGIRDQLSIWGIIHQALFTKDEAPQLVAQLLYLLRITGRAEAFSELKKCLLFLLLGFDSLLDEFHQNTVVAESALLGHSLDLFSDFCRQGYASPDMFCAGSFCHCH